MILHYIIKSKPLVRASQPTYSPSIGSRHHGVGPTQQQHPSLNSPASSPPLLGKYAYEAFLRKCPFKKGDFVFFRKAPFPIDCDDVWLVDEIQEIWYLCADKDTDKPKPLQLRSKFGNYQWASYLDLEIVLDKRICFDPTLNK